jgi:hypothetical protein
LDETRKNGRIEEEEEVVVVVVVEEQIKARKCQITDYYFHY